MNKPFLPHLVKPVRFPQATVRANVLPTNLPPRGLCREHAAAYVGVGYSKFDEMVKGGLMPPPKLVGSRKVWDRMAIDKAFAKLPDSEGKTSKMNNPWDDISA